MIFGQKYLQGQRKPVRGSTVFMAFCQIPLKDRYANPRFFDARSLGKLEDYHHPMTNE
ncbi:MULTISPECIES: hypothetical protein [Planktothricoides]|uniref:Uncharacterized protein n=1 Tax=Planktothricoides raciborskii FACHB-1370 TaxID=2949576 RepID=A0ABR8EA98_9CYAN|nr:MULTISPECIES: hypothetical protein [Planktothricoides]MBD2542551.1 hypothetical protein [Planktothricoides raciborskii FACHB-1370]MBD2581008.1 hypothetical protein [Planktothricoides raciborskii FACHB-1261]